MKMPEEVLCTFSELQYMGSFSVVGSVNTKSDFFSNELHKLRVTSKKKPVSLIVSLSGIKICSPEGKVVYMAHALRRISYATCNPEYSEFNFLAREPKGHCGLQFCHCFKTNSPRSAEELNTIVGNAFRMAYAAQLQKQPTFQEVIASQLDQYQTEKVNWSKDITTALIKEKLSPQNSASDMNVEVKGSSEGATLRLGPPSSIPGLRPTHKFNVLDYPEKVQTSHPSPPSSDESNSPTELNSCKRISEKPPLIKRIAMGLTGGNHQHQIDEDVCPLFSRSSPNSTSSSSANSPSNNGREQCPSGYVNDSTTNSPKISISRTDRIEKEDGEEEEDLENDRLAPQICPAPVEQEFKSKRISQISSSSSSSCQQSSTENTSISFTPTPPPLPERTDSLFKEEGELRTAPWFQAGIPREITLEVLSQEPVGAFMVRESTTKPGCYALSLRVPRNFQPSGIAHYLIIRTNKGFRIKGFTKEFSTLTSLITHHSVMQELLPCPLSLSRYNPSFVKSDSRKDFADIDLDPDYNTLADFRKMMADLK